MKQLEEILKLPKRGNFAEKVQQTNSVLRIFVSFSKGFVKIFSAKERALIKLAKFEKQIADGSKT